MHEKNEQMLNLFHSLLKPDGILSVAIFNEIELVNDPVNGPFTPKGKPKWFRISYEDAMKHYEVIPRIQACGFQMTDRSVGDYTLTITGIKKKLLALHLLNVVILLILLNDKYEKATCHI
jgi:hypothetical protein